MSRELNNVELFKALASHAQKKQFFDRAFDIAIETKDKDLFDALLTIVTDQHYLGGTLIKVLKDTDNKYMFDALLPLVTDQRYLGEVLIKATENKDKYMFDAVFRRIGKTNYYLGDVLIEATKNKDKYIFDTVIPLVENQTYLGKALIEAAKNKDKEKFDPLLLKVNNQHYLGDALIQAVKIPDNKYIFDVLLPLVEKQTCLGKALKEATVNKDKEKLNALLPKVTSNDELHMAPLVSVIKVHKKEFDAILPMVTYTNSLSFILDWAQQQNNEEMVTALNSALAEDVNIRKEKMLKYLLDMKVSPQDFVNHLKIFEKDGYISIIEKSLLEIDDVNFLEQVLKKSNKDNVQNIINKRVEELTTSTMPSAFNEVYKVANYVIEKTSDIFGGLPGATAQDIQIDNSKALSSLIQNSNNLITSDTSINNQMTRIAPTINTDLPGVIQQVQLGLTLAQLINNSYKTIQNYFNKLPNKIDVSQELQETNDKLHRRLINLSNASGLLQELDNKSHWWVLESSATE